MAEPVSGLDTIILCGGRGTRAYPDTVELPKALLDVAGVPIVERVMGIYAAQGHTRFILAGGYLVEALAERFASSPPGITVEVVDTGLETLKGDRVKIAAEHVRGDDFFVTYADGLGDVDLGSLLACHHRNGALATVTTVPLPSQYGTLVFDTDGRITDFREKPQLDDHWINAGFFVISQKAFEHWEGAELESDVFPALARRGCLFAHGHRGFWKSMDTFKDRQELNALAEEGRPPWELGA